MLPYMVPYLISFDSILIKSNQIKSKQNTKKTIKNINKYLKIEEHRAAQ